MSLRASVEPLESRTLLSVASAADTPVTSGWRNERIARQNSRFTIEFDAAATAAGQESLVGLSFGASDAASDQAVTVRFAPTGEIQVRDGRAYRSSSDFIYTPGETYRFTVKGSLETHRYSVKLTTADGTEIQLATAVAFRWAQANIAALNTWSAISYGGELQVRNVSVSRSNSVVRMGLPPQGKVYHGVFPGGSNTRRRTSRRRRCSSTNRRPGGGWRGCTSPTTGSTARAGYSPRHGELDQKSRVGAVHTADDDFGDEAAGHWGGSCLLTAADH